MRLNLGVRRRFPRSLEVKMSLRRGGLVGAVLAVSAFTLTIPVSPTDFLDPAPWFIYAGVAFVGAFFGVSAVFAGQHVRESPRWLLPTLIGLLLLSQPLVSSFVRETRDTQRFLSSAASTQGVVANKYVRGGIHLVVEYRVQGQVYRVTKTGQNPHVGTQAFTRWSRGDSIPVYYNPAEPHTALVGDPGPERRFLFEALAKRWILWGVLLTAYLPLIIRGLRKIAVRGTRRPVPEV
jgi:hypothetical protein